MLVVFRRKNPDWRLLYRERSAAGVWGPVETVSVPWSERPSIIEDPLGRPHMFYEGSEPGGKTDLYEAYKQDGVWHVSQMTNTSDIDEGYACLEKDSLGKMLLVYTKTGGNLYYRTWSGSWSGEMSVGSSVGNTYYQRPDLSVDSSNNFHMVYEDNTHLYYRKFNGSSWSAEAVISTTSNFFSYPKIAAISPSAIVAVTFDQETVAKIKYVSSSNGGASWTGLQTLADGHYPQIDAYNGTAYLVYERSPDGVATGYRTWNGSAWTAQQLASNGPDWQGWADVAADTNGYAHCVYDDNSDHISYTNNQSDGVAPMPVTQFNIDASDCAAYLSWSNPSDLDLQGSKIVYRNDRYPTSQSDGTPVCDRPATPNSTDVYIHTGLTNGLTYYYAAFAYDSSYNYSSATTLTANPQITACGDARQLANNKWVAIRDKIITAIFPSEACIYVEEPSRTSGIRVANSGSGYSVGDKVHVSGTMATFTQNGCPAERVISSPTLTPLYLNQPLKPVALQCQAVGGAAIAPNTPGVEGGVGINNIGLLVKIAGKVTMTVGNYVYVDDGSNLDNGDGTVGVLVDSPSTPTVVVGNIVSAIGIIEGNIPAGWTENRRCIKLRAASDLALLSNNMGTISGYVTDSGWNAISGAVVSTTTGGYSTTTNGTGAYI